MDINNNQQTNTFTKGMNTDSSELYIPTDQYRYAENLRLLTDVDSTFGELHTIRNVEFEDILDGWVFEEEQSGDQPGEGDTQPEIDPEDENEWHVYGDYRTIKKGESDAYASYGSANGKVFVIDDYDIVSLKYDDGKEGAQHQEPDYIQDKVLKLIPENGPAKFFKNGQQIEKTTEFDYTVFVTLENDGRTLHFSLNFARMNWKDYVNEIWPIRIQYNVQGTKQDPASARPSGDQDIPSFSKVFATTVIRHYGIIVCSLRNEFGWSILRYDSRNGQVVRIFGPCKEAIGESVSIVGRWESDNNIKVYIADGKHELMSANIDDENRLKGTHTEIEYLTQYNTVPLSSPDVSIDENVVGQLHSAVVQYAYILYKDGGSQTDLSPLSKPISLYKNAYQGFYNENTNKSVRVDINVDAAVATPLNKMKIFRLTYIENGQPPQVHVVYDGDINTSYTDNGFDVEEIAYAEFLSNENIHIKPLLIESKNDYLFAGNIEYVQEDVDKKFDDYISYITVSPAQQQYYMNSSGSIADMDGVDGEYGPSLRVGETYRYGVIFYDSKGRKSSVKWLTDYTVPETLDPVQSIYYYTDVTLSGDIPHTGCIFNRFGLRFTVQPNIPDCSGIEIVRCQRTLNDTKNLYQGIVSLTTEDKLDLGNDHLDDRYIFPTLYYSLWRPQNVSDKYLIFACPEYAYQKDDVQQVLDTYDNTQLNCVHFYRIADRENENERRPGIAKFAPYIIFPWENTIVQNDSDYVYRVFPEELLTDHVGNSTELQYYDGNNLRYFYPSYITPRGKIYPSEEQESEFQNIKINNTYYSTVPDPLEFDDQDKPNVLNDTLPLDSRQFVNWYISLFDGSVQDTLSRLFGGDAADSVKLFAAGGRCMVLDANTQLIQIKAMGLTGTGYTNSQLEHWKIPITIANITRSGTVVPYGGNNNDSKKYSTYYSFGNYKQYNADNGISIDVYDGDCYNCMFIYNAAQVTNTVKPVTQFPVFYSVPVQSSIDLRAACGDLYPHIQNNAYLAQDEPSQLYGYTQTKPAYLYDTAYNSLASAMPHTYIERTSIDTSKYDTRVVSSQQKINGEHIDNWQIFKSADFIDVDTRYGQLTNIRLFKDTLIFWQNSAAGILSANERTIIQDQNDTNIILGNGDVLQRYDYLTTEYGMKPYQLAETQSNTTLYWWDGYKKEILSYAGGQNVQPMNKLKTVANYINENEESSRPSLVCDHKYNEVLMNVVNGETLVYNEAVQAFTSIYKIPFQHCMRFNDKLIVENKCTFGTWDAGEWMKPKLQYIVNNNPQMVKVFDITVFGLNKWWHIYKGGDTVTIQNEWKHQPDSKLDSIHFAFDADGVRHSYIDGQSNSGYITSREYDYRFTIPRADNAEYGNRMRGRTMSGTMSLLDNYKDFSIQYITTKYRISYS